jgi:hypothetical protein
MKEHDQSRRRSDLLLFQLSDGRRRRRRGGVVACPDPVGRGPWAVGRGPWAADALWTQEIDRPVVLSAALLRPVAERRLLLKWPDV